MNSRDIGRVIILLLSCAFACTACTCGNEGQPNSESATTKSPAFAESENSDEADREGDSNPTEITEVPAIPAPDSATVIITSGIRGYTEPCGCSEALQLGGIDRLAHVARELSSSGPSINLDAGDMFFQELELAAATRAQEMARAEVIADAARHIDVRWTVPGSYDLADGTETYRRLTERANVEVITTNGSATLRERLNAVTHVRASIDGWDLLVVGLTDPGTLAADHAADFRAIDESLSELRADLGERTWDAAIVLFQGTAQSAQTLLRTSDAFAFDFVVVGKATRSGSGLLSIADTIGIEVFDQAREVGGLRLFGDPGQASEPRWTPLQSASNDRRSTIEAQIARTAEQVAQLAERLDGRDSPLLDSMEERLATYRDELEQLDDTQPGTVAPPADRNSFYWHTVEVIPQFARDADVEVLRETFNESLRELNLANSPPPPQAEAGRPLYVGGSTCKGCHQPADHFWGSTAHGTAIDTLIERNKRYDTSCVGCHVTGFNQPGGSSLGHLDGLENVQCESCHGPGSAHAANPTDVAMDINVSLQVEASTCLGCHTPEHSPEFDYDNYRLRILGTGHESLSVE